MEKQQVKDIAPGQYRVFGGLRITVNRSAYGDVSWNAGRLTWLVSLLLKARRALGKPSIKLGPVTV